MALIDNVAIFWRWFSAHESMLAAKTIPSKLISELEERLFAVAHLDWEIGPGKTAASLFAISPKGDREKLNLTRRVIAQAPKLNGWEFYPAKPARKWNLEFRLNAKDGPVDVDGKKWEFVAYRFDDGTYDLVLKPDRDQGLPDDYLGWAATIIVDGELGEEKRIEAIGNIEVLKAWDKDAAKSARKLEVGLLKKVIE
jgi:hypothetical protein